MRRSVFSRIAAAVVLPMLASMPAAGQGSAGYDYPGGYAGRFDGTMPKGGAGAKETITIHGAPSLSVAKRTKGRGAGGGRLRTPAATGQQGYWNVPSFRGGTRIDAPAPESGGRLQAK